MAQRVQVLLVDDIDGNEARETVSFGLDGVSYEIDLSEGNASELRNQFSTWIGHARRSGGRKITGRRPGSGPSRQDLNEIRQWGRANGFQVSDRGRVSRELQEAYDKANS